MNKEQGLPSLKLYMLLLGSKAPGRNVEQHDFYFGIGRRLKDLLPAIRAFWPEAGKSIHIDGWREVTSVDGYRISVVQGIGNSVNTGPKLFFVNLGGYQSGILEEQHYTVLGVYTDRLQAMQYAKKTVFYREQSVKGIKGANSHIDEKYGIDVDEVYQIEDILPVDQKSDYHIILEQDQGLEEDTIHLGYLTLDKLSNMP